MTSYQAVPHQLYPSTGRKTLHFNEETLDLTALPKLHRSLLAEFTRPRTKEEVLAHYGDTAETVIDELIELGVIVREPPPPPAQEFNLRPNIGAFRIVLTEKCNIRCAECFVTKMASGLRTMTPQTLDRVIRGTIPHGARKSLKYHFFGGEPLLRFDHIKRAVELIEGAIAEGVMVRPTYAITTNATIVSDEIISFFKEHGFKVGVSIDGPKEINDKLRVYVNGRGTFETVKENYLRMVEAGIDCHVLITPHPDYLSELPDIFREVLEAFPMKTVTVNTPLHFDNVQWTVPGDAYAVALVKLIRIAREFGVDVDSGASPPLAALAGNIRREGPCALVCDTVMASIGPDGSMSYCSQKWHPYLTVPLAPDTKLETPIRRADDCLTCEARGICGGPCPAFQKISGGFLDGNKCDFMRALLRETAAHLDLFEATPP